MYVHGSFDESVVVTHARRKMSSKIKMHKHAARGARVLAKIFYFCVAFNKTSTVVRCIWKLKQLLKSFKTNIYFLSKRIDYLT